MEFLADENNSQKIRAPHLLVDKGFFANNANTISDVNDICASLIEGFMMNFRVVIRLLSLCSMLLVSTFSLAGPLEKMGNYAEVFGLAKDQLTTSYSVQEIISSAPANVLWPGDSASFTLQITNKTNVPIDAEGRLEVINYGTYSDPQDSWKQLISKYGVVWVVTLEGEYCGERLCRCQGESGDPGKIRTICAGNRSTWAGNVRWLFAVCGYRVRDPVAFNIPPSPWTYRLIHIRKLRCSSVLGIKGMRIEWGYKPTTDRDYYSYFARLAGRMKFLEDNDITVMLTSGGGGATAVRDFSALIFR